MIFTALSRPLGRRRRRRHLKPIVQSAAAASAAIITERLEARQLMAFSVGVNFQPAGSAVPAGYIADSGLAYANRGNGFTYGWNATTATTRDRGTLADQRYDTLIHTWSKTWEIAVPNGAYDVKLVAGDPNYFDSVYKFNAEGVLALSGTPTGGNRFFTATKTVTVNDGKLTISNAAGAQNNKLAFLEISDAGDELGSIPNVPTTIQTEDFDDGGKYVSYFDTTYGNAGNIYRSTDVDLVPDNGGGYAVAYTRPGEWLKYTFNAPLSGTFNLDLRFATNTAGGVVHVEVDGVDKTGPMNLANTGGWQQWKTISKSGVSIGAGQHVMRLVFDKSTTGGDIGDISWIKFTAVGGPTTPAISIAASDNSASEPGTNTGKFTISRTGSTTSSLAIKYAITGSATNGTDYNSLATTVTIPAGSSSTTVTVTPKDDASIESNETVTLTLAPITGYNLGGAAAATVTIADNDVPSTNGDWPSSWAVKAPIPRVRQEARGGVMDGKVWVFGGFYSSATNTTSQVDIYEIASNTWSKLPEFGPMPQTHSSVAFDPANHAMYFVGGLYGDFPSTPTDRVFKFNTLTRTWSDPLPKLPIMYHSGGAAIVNGMLHFFGGSEKDRVTDTGRHLVLNLNNPSSGWQPAAALPDGRCHFSSVVLNGKIYAIGGQHRHDQHTDQSAAVHRYDPATNAWTKLADLPTPKSHAENSTFVYDGKIIMAGGQIGRFGSTDEVVSYDPATNKWTKIGTLPVPQQAGFVVPEGNKIIVTIGNRGDGSPRGDTWIGELE